MVRKVGTRTYDAGTPGRGCITIIPGVSSAALQSVVVGFLQQFARVDAYQQLIYHSPSLIHVEILSLWGLGCIFIARHVPSSSGKVPNRQFESSEPCLVLLCAGVYKRDCAFF